MSVYNRLLMFLSIIGAIITISRGNYIAYDYKSIWILPVTFTILLITVFQVVLQNKNIRITALSLITLLFLKNVLNPVLISLAGKNYMGKRYIPLSTDDINFAINVSAYELVVVSIFIFLISFIIKPSENKLNFTWELGGNKLFYFIYVAFALCLFLAFGRTNNVVSFFVFSSSENYTPINDTFLLLVRQITVIAVVLVFLLALNYSKEKYYQSYKTRYINYAIFFAIINIGIIVGDRRSVQIFTGILSIWLLIKTFKTNYKKIVIAILLTTFTIFSFMTLYRWGGYGHNSYTEIIKTLNFDMEWLADYGQAYFGGPNLVATSIVFSDYITLTFKNMFFDFGRTIFGVNFLLRDKMHITSELYNQYIYGGEQLTGQLIFSTSYGYMFFGFLGSPTIIILNTCVALFLEKLFRNAATFETAYLFGYCLLRMVLNLLTNTPTIMSVITLELGTLGLLILISKLLKINVRKHGRFYQKFS